MVIRINKTINYLILIQVTWCLFEEIIYSYNSKLGFLFLVPEMLGMLYLFLALAKRIFCCSKMKVNARSHSDFLLGAFVIYVILSIAWSNWDIYAIFTRFRYIIMGSVTYWVVHENLTDEFYRKILNIMCVAHVINFLLVLYQSFIQGIDVDFSNGIFGFTGYANAAQGSFCVALSLLSFVYYVDKTWHPARCFIMLGMSCVICAVSEIKIYFGLLVLGIIGIVAIRKNDFKERMRIIGIGAVVAALLYLAYRILMVILPQNVYALFSMAGYLQYDGRSDYAGRTNAITYIYEHLFRGDFHKALFGMGLGSSASDYIYELGKSFSEFGFIGLLLILFFLLSIFWLYFSPKRKKLRTQEQLFVAAYAGVFLVAIVVWNCTFTRFTYLNFFFLAISGVVWNKRGEEKSIENQKAKKKRSSIQRYINYGTKQPI